MCWGDTLFKRLLLFIVVGFLIPHAAWCSIASTDYVRSIVDSIEKTSQITSASTDTELPTAQAVWELNATVSGAIAEHVADTANPHSVTKAQVGLSNVPNVDTTNAANITSGTLSTSRLSVGTVSGTVAAGNDARFYGVPRGQPTGEAPAGMVWMWFE